MAIKYKLYQDNRAESTTRGKWYARAIYPTTPKSTKDLAQMIQDNVSVKRADVIAVLDELVNVMKLWLQESYRVKLDGFGSFKIGLKTKPADTAKDFSAAKHVVGSRVNFSLRPTGALPTATAAARCSSRASPSKRRPRTRLKRMAPPEAETK